MEKLKAKIKNMKVRGKMLFLDKVVFVGLFFVMLWAVIGASTLNGQTKEITQNWMKAVELAEEMNFLTAEYRMKQFGHIVSTDSSQWDIYEEELAAIDIRIKEIEEEYAKTISSDEDRELYDTSILAWEYYVGETGEKLFSLSRAGQLDNSG